MLNKNLSKISANCWKSTVYAPKTTSPNGDAGGCRYRPEMQATRLDPPWDLLTLSPTECIRGWRGLTPGYSARKHNVRAIPAVSTKWPYFLDSIFKPVILRLSICQQLLDSISVQLCPYMRFWVDADVVLLLKCQVGGKSERGHVSPRSGVFTSIGTIQWEIVADCVSVYGYWFNLHTTSYIH